MQTGFLQVLPLLAVAAAAFVLWLVAAWSMLSMLRHVRGGRWFALLFKPGWWNPRRADAYIEPAGMPHYRRLMRSIAWFLVAVLCGIAYGLLQVALGN